MSRKLIQDEGLFLLLLSLLKLIYNISTDTKKYQKKKKKHTPGDSKLLQFHKQKTGQVNSMLEELTICLLERYYI